MSRLIGLKGTDGEVEAVDVQSKTGAMGEIRKGAAAVTSAGDNGAINVWVDSHKKYRCEFMRFMSVKSSEKFRYKADVKRWLDIWFPEMRR